MTARCPRTAVDTAHLPSPGCGRRSGASQGSCTFRPEPRPGCSKRRHQPNQPSDARLPGLDARWPYTWWRTAMKRSTCPRGSPSGSPPLPRETPVQAWPASVPSRAARPDVRQLIWPPLGRSGGHARQNPVAVDKRSGAATRCAVDGPTETQEHGPRKMARHVRTGVTRLTSGFAPCRCTRRHSSNGKLEEAAQMTRGKALVRGGRKATGNEQNRRSATRCAGR
jgi:hypothetical protein